MSKIGPLSFGELVRKLKSFGFDGPYPGGKHLFMIRSDLRLTLPNPHKEKIGVDLIRRLMRQGGISRRDWEEE
jgi:predicted RNA binding protein YcfA (HicA-like mRNA interferase family)